MTQQTVLFIVLSLTLNGLTEMNLLQLRGSHIGWVTLIMEDK